MSKTTTRYTTQGSGFWQATCNIGWGLCWYEKIHRDIRWTSRFFKKLSSSMEFSREEKYRIRSPWLDGQRKIPDALYPSCECVSQNPRKTKPPYLSHKCQSLVNARIKNPRWSESLFSNCGVNWWLSMQSTSFRYILYWSRWGAAVSEEELLIICRTY